MKFALCKQTTSTRSFYEQLIFLVAKSNINARKWHSSFNFSYLFAKYDRSRTIVYPHLKSCNRLLVNDNCVSWFGHSSITRSGETNDETTENEREEVPVSLMGSGFNKKIRLFRRLKKKEVQTESDDDVNDLPVALNVKLKSFTEMCNRFPELSKLNQPDVKAENEAESQAIQYPYQSNLHLKISKSDDMQQKFDEEMTSTRENMLKINDGTPDPSIPITDIPCGGCGALLHCKDSSLPGYIPSERFKTYGRRKLRCEMCQRCLYLQHFNVALNVSVDVAEYPKLISEIKDKKALIILMVDVLDFPCSIWPGIVDIIGPKRPILVVVNKVDLLVGDGKNYLNHVKSVIEQNLKDVGVDTGNNIKHISLISAKTGFGVEELITKLHNVWRNKGDAYLIGCTNVGKSTLFNALIQSDYCKVQAVDLVQRATVSPWPGTTLNLLKFPILKPTKKRLYQRVVRIIEDRKSLVQERKMKKYLWEETNDVQHATLMGRVGMTFKEAVGDRDVDDKKLLAENKDVFYPKAPEFAHGYFCYDTPGAIYFDQILHILTIDELMLTLPKEIIIPRTFRLRNSQTLFLAGLARVDILEIQDFNHVYITVFASHRLPVHIVYQNEAERFYKNNLGTDLLIVPSGNSERLKDFPPLVPKEITITGKGWKECCADVVLSSAGWISITAGREKVCKFKIYTPDGRGCHLRQPSLLPFAIIMKGKRVSGTPAFRIFRKLRVMK